MGAENPKVSEIEANKESRLSSNADRGTFIFDPWMKDNCGGGRSGGKSRGWKSFTEIMSR